MFCTNCGKPIPDDSRFCTECGAPVELVEAVEAFDAPEQPVYQQEPQQPVYQQESQEPVYQQEPQEPVYQQEPQEPVYQQPAYKQPVYQQPVYQQPVYQQPVYPNAPKTFDMGAIWNNPAKRGYLFMLITAVTAFIVLFFNFTKVESYSYYWDGWDLVKISGYELIGHGTFAAWMVGLSVFVAVGIIVFSILSICNVNINKMALKIIFMSMAISFAVFSFAAFIGVSSNYPTICFGSYFYFLLGGGMVFVYFFLLHRAFSNKPAAPQPVYNQPMGM